MALFSVIVIGCPRDLLNLIPGFPGEGGSGRFIILLGIMVFLRVILRLLVECLAPFYVAAF